MVATGFEEARRLEALLQEAGHPRSAAEIVSLLQSALNDDLLPSEVVSLALGKRIRLLSPALAQQIGELLFGLYRALGQELLPGERATLQANAARLRGALQRAKASVAGQAEASPQREALHKLVSAEEALDALYHDLTTSEMTRRFCADAKGALAHIQALLDSSSQALAWS